MANDGCEKKRRKFLCFPFFQPKKCPFYYDALHVKEILMIPTPIVTFSFCFALLICSTLFVSISQILFQIYRHFFRARFLSPDPSRTFHRLPFGSRLFFQNLLSNILEPFGPASRILSVGHFVLPQTHVAPGIIDNLIYLAHIRAFFYQLCH